jgi:hypothetical protein
MTLTIVGRCDEPSKFAEWEAAPELSHVRGHPTTSAAGTKYYADTHPDAVDASFAVVHAGAPQLMVKCNALGGTLGYFSGPITLLARGHLAREIRDQAIRVALGHLDLLAAKHNAHTVAIREEKVDDGPTLLEVECMARGGTKELWQTGLCDLALSETEIHGRIRKSFKSLVNWGRRNLTLKYFRAENPDPALFDSYRDFHAQIAGRITRSDASWNSMRNWILSGTGELGLAYLEVGELVAGTMIVDGEETSVYASGVYDRTRFEMPLSHFAIYNAILRSRNRGLKWFDLGHLPEKGSVTDKEYNIGFFKRGFATDIGMYDVWKYNVTGLDGARV